MNVGYFESFLFISHPPDCRNMADHIPRLERTRIRCGDNYKWPCGVDGHSDDAQ
jgi:hypothetical protein